MNMIELQEKAEAIAIEEAKALIETDTTEAEGINEAFWGISPNRLREIIEDLGLIYLDIRDSNGWQWDYWEHFISQDKKYAYTLSAEGYYGGLGLNKMPTEGDEGKYLIDMFIESNYDARDKDEDEYLNEFIAKEIRRK